MQKIVIIIGLPGSGKTTYIKQQSEQFTDFLVCDDYHKSLHINRPARSFQDSLYYHDLREAIISGKSVVMADIGWCRSERLQAMQQGLAQLCDEVALHPHIEYIYFENELEICKRNVLHRGREEERITKEHELIDRMTENYHIPSGVKAVGVFDASLG